MKCPKCSSTDTRKVSVLDPDWKRGAQRCKQCHHQDHWVNFCEHEPNLPKKIGWEAWEIVEYGPLNLVRCAACLELVEYNGLMPNKCPACQEDLKPS